MSLKRNLSLALRSLLAMVMACVVIVLVNQVGGGFADATGFPNGGEPRLAWDLAWVFIAGVFATWAVAKLAPRAPRAHAAVFFVLMLVISALAVAQLGDNWPRWFSVGLLLALPLQAWLGARWALRGNERA